ncbi:MAG: ATP-grasp domain-containing protein [Alphaproteobacteria bacterium]|nr:ATP-grasp domain-containing protein [Alphaproteobacteria bacterium]
MVQRFGKVLVANRGAVAMRVLRALGAMGIASVAVYSDADAGAPWLELAGEAHRIGPGPVLESYLDQDGLLALMARTKADALHPGYGFLSENAGFARRVAETGATFIGPSARWIDAMGHKTRARELARRYGLPVAAGSDVLPAEPGAIAAAARAIGFPVLVKPAAGGGGIGMAIARDEASLLAAVQRASSLAQRSFASGEVYLERLVERPRHVEIQILADSHNAATHVFERDCSTQRRQQKIVEEAPAPSLARDRIETLARDVAGKLAAAGYDNIGTVEMLMDRHGAFTFLEMNTRLQVEHGVTEEVTGIDLVRAQIRLAAGEALADVLPRPLAMTGHAIQARLYAEDPKRFLPSPGRLDVFRPPEGDAIRVETGYREGQTVSPYYDPMLAKLIVRAPTRAQAIERLLEALAVFEVRGVKTNIPALVAVLGSDAFRTGAVHTGIVDEIMGRA